LIKSNHILESHAQDKTWVNSNATGQTTLLIVDLHQGVSNERFKRIFCMVRS